MDDIDGFILAGGANSRMGRRKAAMMLGSKTLVERARSNLSDVAKNIRVIGEREAGFPDANLNWIDDLAAEEPSSMRGLMTALTYCATPWAMVLACDLPFVSGPLLARIASFRNDQFETVVPVQPDGRLQPLCALYKRDKCLQKATEMMDAGDRSLHLLVKQLNSRRLNFEEIKDLEYSDLFFTNLNTPDDLERAKTILNVSDHF